MTQRFSNNIGVQQSDIVTDGAKRFSLLNTRKCFDEVLASSGFAQAIKDEQVFLVLRRINGRTINEDIDKLIETLRTFGTPTSYDYLAELCFRNYISTKLTQSDLNKINIEVTLGAQIKQIITQSGSGFVTNSDTTQLQLVATERGSQQERNDFDYLVNYLAPNPREITITYTEG